MRFKSVRGVSTRPRPMPCWLATVAHSSSSKKPKRMYSTDGAVRKSPRAATFLSFLLPSFLACLGGRGHIMRVDRRQATSRVRATSFARDQHHPGGYRTREKSANNQRTNIAYLYSRNGVEDLICAHSTQVRDSTISNVSRQK